MDSTDEGDGDEGSLTPDAPSWSVPGGETQPPAPPAPPPPETPAPTPEPHQQRSPSSIPQRFDPSRPPPPPPVPLASGYRSPAAIARALRIALLGLVLLSGVAAAASLTEAVLLSRLLDKPFSVDIAELQSVDDRQVAIGLLQIVFGLGIAITFIVWTRRIYRNLQPLGTRNLRHSEAWAVGAWFVPFLNLVRPKQLIDDVWRASDPDLWPEGELMPRQDLSWQFLPVTPLLHWWWGLYLTSAIGGLFIARGSVDLSGSVADARNAAIWFAIDDSFQIIVAVFAFLMVTRLTRRQEAWAERILADTTLELDTAVVATGGRDPSWTGLAIVTVLGVALVPLGFLFFEGTAGSGAAEASQTSGSETLLENLEVGDCLDLPPSFDPTSLEEQFVLAVEVLPCDSTHTLEVAAFTESVEGPSASYPSTEDLSLAGYITCLDPFREFVGVSWLESGLDIFLLYPDKVAWSLGDRRFTCMATSLGGASLATSVRGSGGVVQANQRLPWTLQEGECFDNPVEVGDFTYELVGCETPHDAQTYAVITRRTTPSGAYPGDNAIALFAEEACQKEFRRTIDDALSDELDFGIYSSPYPVSWAAGDREVVCVLWNAGLEKLDRTALESDP